MMIDLHTHSTCSDGSLTPEALAAAAHEAGLTAIALTDHDSTGGLARFESACEALGVRAVPGVEISAQATPGTMHILGYCLKADDPDLQESLRHIREGRQVRNLQIINVLNDIGFDITWDEVRAVAGDDVVGRPHFAEVMIRKGIVSGKRQAFDRFLGKGKPAYVDRFRFSPRESIESIRRAGGVPVLAHPFTLKVEGAELEREVRQLRDWGLEGIEVYYTEHSAERTRRTRRLAEKLDLMATGGSDFHGAMNPDVRLGRGFGNLDIPDSILSELDARCAVIRAAA